MFEGSQFSLLVQRRFLPFFVVQFLGAFNDNVFKNALVILIVFQLGAAAGETRYLVNLSAALFILPFFLFSSVAGQIGDYMEKSRLIRRIKLAEICIMLMGVVGFYLQSVYLLMGVLFLMGTQSAIFGPTKYSYVPQYLHRSELVGGNGLVEMGTFMAVLLGMIYGSYTMTLDAGWFWVSVSVVAIACMGYLGSRFIPETLPVDAKLKVNWNVLTGTWRTLLLLAQQQPIVLYAALGISWFWFLGSTYIVQLPNYTREILVADESVYIVLLTLFCIGIGVGSVTCEKLSRHRVEMGLVPVGAVGMSIFGVDLFFAAPQGGGASAALIGIDQFIRQSGAWRSFLDIVLVGLFGGVYIVPLYAVIQERAPRRYLSRIIAGNNIVNALLMVMAAGYAVLLLGYMSLSEAGLFLVSSVLNFVVALFLVWRIAELRQRLWQLVKW